MTHSLLDRFMNATAHLTFFQRRICALLERLCCIVTVHVVGGMRWESGRVMIILVNALVQIDM